MLRAWIKTEAYAQTRSDLTEAVHRELTDAGISIPFPQRDVHVYQHNAADGSNDPGNQDITAEAAAAGSD